MVIADRKLAVVTGASSGIGAAFATQLAARGMDLVIIARREERLNAMAQEWRKQNVDVRVLAADLTDRAALQNVEKEIAALTHVDVLVNSAGFGIYGDFAGADPARIDKELYLDLIVPARLSRAVLPGMIARHAGAIINVASMAGFMPIPRFAPYCAAKAGLIRLTQALRGELRGTGVRVQVLCPGPVPTPFFDVSGYKVEDVPKPMLQSAEACVASSLRAMDRGKTVHIPHAIIALFTGFMRSLPLPVKLVLLGGGTDWWTK
jgi:short-subunit dehydrogenase